MSPDESNGKWVTILSPVSPAHGGDDGEKEGRNPEEDQDGNSDENHRQGNAQQRVQIEGEVEIERLFGMEGDHRGLVLFDEVHDERDDQAEAEQQGEVGDDDPEFVFALHERGRLVGG